MITIMEGVMVLEGFIDATAILRCGVYVLSQHGRIVYVGKSKAPLTRIYAHRNLARKRPVPWLSIKGVVFDSVHIMPCHPDRVDALEQSLIAEFQPMGNIQHNPAYHAPQVPLVERRA